MGDRGHPVKLEQMDFKNALTAVEDQIRSNMIALKANKAIRKMLQKNLTRLENNARVAAQFKKD